MTFQPRMRNRIEGFTVIGGLRRRTWNGIIADLWDVECAAYAGGYYVADDPRLFILLDHRGDGRPKVKRSRRDSGSPQDRRESPISYIPAGMDLWVDISGVQTLNHLDIHFDPEVLQSRLMEEIDPQRLNDPRLLFADQRVTALAELIAAEIASGAPLHDLYGDGLAVALLVDVLKIVKTPSRSRGGLATWQLNRVTDFLEANCSRTVRLQELAALIGLSQSHFSHCFKASTGMAPHDWQMKARIEKAKQLIIADDQPLTHVAADAGFADNAHFSRVFRRYVGTSPTQWKKSQLA